MKYCVKIVRTGCVLVEAENECEAIDIANCQTTDSILWSDDWRPVDAFKDNSYEDCMYVKNKASD